jgi:hypothetical protein
VIVLVNPHCDERAIRRGGLKRLNQIGVGKQTTL